MKRRKRQAAPQRRRTFVELVKQSATHNVSRELRNRWTEKITDPKEAAARETLAGLYRATTEAS